MEKIFTKHYFELFSLFLCLLFVTRLSICRLTSSTNVSFKRESLDEWKSKIHQFFLESFCQSNSHDLSEKRSEKRFQGAEEWVGG